MADEAFELVVCSKVNSLNMFRFRGNCRRETTTILGVR